MGILIKTNNTQTPITEELLSNYPEEVREQFLDFIATVPFISNLISPNRPEVKDLPRDNKGRAIIDITNPPIIRNTDYFRQTVLQYMKNDEEYTLLKPNSNPNSEYRKFWDREVDRIYDGYLREEDGLWIPGYLYWELNYEPMLINEIKKGSKRAIRKVAFPLFFDGTLYRFTYLNNAIENGHHAAELAKRGCGKSYGLASIMSRNLLFGKSKEAKKRWPTVLTAYQKEYLRDDKDGTFSKFIPTLSHVFATTPFPHLMLKNSPNEMVWQMGFKNMEGAVDKKSSLNTVMGVSAKDDSDKLRGKRADILFEEFGNFNGLLELYDACRRGTEDGDFAFSTMYMIGTANNKESNFQSAKTLLYAPKAYNIEEVENVYDKKGQGNSKFAFFYPAYLNRAGCMDEDGNSDVVAALLQILMRRYDAKYGADPTSVLRVIAEDPITPAEAIVKVKDAFFPIQTLTERARQLDMNPNAYNDVYVGDLYTNSSGEIAFAPTDAQPIRTYPVPNDTKGALEIYEMPVKDKEGKIFDERYIAGSDPYDNDQAESSSLYSIFVFDLFKDTIVAEYTGRTDYANDAHEMVRKLCLFYNAKALYEAHPYDQIVRTPEGETKLWGEIKVGDSLFAPNGKQVKVVDIPIDGVDDIYKITLSDGRTIEASSNHIWKVGKVNNKKSFELTTLEMYKTGVRNKYGQHNFYIPESGVINYPHRDVSIDPYTLGLLIAEGSFAKIRKEEFHHKARNLVVMSSALEDMEEYKKKIPYDVVFNGGYTWSVRIKEINFKLRELGLAGCKSETKFIPDLYLFNDYETRLSLLKGLMDGDGCAIPTGASVYITTSPQLKEDIMLLCRSLGIKTSENSPCEPYKMKNGNISLKSYRIAIAATMPVFNLSRKIEKQHIYSPFAKGSKASALLYKTPIEKIEYIGKKKCKCVTVDSKDGLYLIGDYVTTHNCNKKGLFSYMESRHCTYLLADTPEYLRDKQLIKYSNFGSSAKGVNASAAINSYANRLLKDWLNSPVPTIIKNEDGSEEEVNIPRAATLKSRAFIEEGIQYNPAMNFDRIRSMGMVMLYREEYIIRYGGNLNEESREKVDRTDLSNDPFFTRNYDDRVKY